MKKTVKMIGMVFVLCLFLGMPVLAEENKERDIPEQRQLPRLVDEADLLSATEEEELLEHLDEISERQQCDVAVVTIDSLEGKGVVSYADDFYDYNGYGMGSGDDGVLFLISMEEREWAISTYGYGITAFTDAGLDYMEKEFLPDLKDGNYMEAFTAYAGLCDDFLTQAKEGEPYDTGNLPMSSMWILYSLLIGAVLAFVTTGVMRMKLKTVRKELSAMSYVKEGSMNITDSRDMFLYRHVSKTAIPKSSSSGGSSTHRSSSGRSHGGSSGKF